MLVMKVVNKDLKGIMKIFKIDDIDVCFYILIVWSVNFFCFRFCIIGVEEM